MRQIALIIGAEMKFLAFSLLLIGIVSTQAAAPSVNALSEEAVQAMRSPNSAILYSIEPAEQPKPGDKVFHGFKVLEQTNLDPKQAKLAADAFQKAVRDWDSVTYESFEPRHALRISSGGHTYDFLLCYQCHELDVYKDDKLLDNLGVAGSPKFLNGMLTEAHVPLAHPER
jgi:hypothetical protein